MKQVSIIGAGTMGHGIAQSFAVHGWQVRLHDVDRSIVETAQRRIQTNLSVFVEAGLLAPQEAEEALDRVACFHDLTETVDGSELVIEAVPEELELKRKLFLNLEGLVDGQTIFCTNTSAISITAIGRFLKHRDRLLGTHFWNPPHIIPCVEVIKSPYTSEAVFETVVSIMAGIGKEPIRVLKDVPGFIGNRMQHALQREAMHLVDQGIAAPDEVDRVVKYGFGLRLALMGPLERADLGGLDITYKVQKYLLPHLCQDTEPASLLKEKVDHGRLGAKTGEGFYHWSPEKKAETIAHRDRQLLALLKLIHQQK
jgi:3-hydroxybutyryl-CoA dehydrogenase